MMGQPGSLACVFLEECIEMASLRIRVGGEVFKGSVINQFVFVDAGRVYVLFSFFFIFAFLPQFFPCGKNQPCRLSIIYHLKFFTGAGLQEIRYFSTLCRCGLAKFNILK